MRAVISLPTDSRKKDNMNESAVCSAKPAIEEEQVEALDNGLFFLAVSPAMKTLRSQLQLIARVDVPVLMLGESGVGKEVIARLIHKLSKSFQIETVFARNCFSAHSFLLF